MSQHTRTLSDRYRTHRDALVSRADATHYGSRKRGVLLTVVGVVGLASMFQLVSANVLAVNFTTMNSTFQLYTNYLQGEQVAGYLNKTSRENGLPVPVAEVGVKQASLAGLCLIANQSLGPLGDYSLVLTAGDKVGGSFTHQSGLPVTDPNYYLPTGWSAGTDVWGTGGDPAQGQYVGALKGARQTGAVRATNLYLNTTSLRGAGYKVSGLYLGERAQDVGDKAGVAWEAGAGAPPPPTDGGFGLRVEHLNLAGTQLWTDGSPAIEGSPAVPDQPATPDTTVTTSDGPPTIVGLESNHAEVHPTDNGGQEAVGSIVDGQPATKWLARSPTAYATYTLSQPFRVSSYQISSANDVPARDPRSWTLQGSTTGTAGPWTTLDTVTANSFDARNSVFNFSVDDPGYYKYYRLNVTANNGDPYLQMAELTLSDVGLLGSTIAPTTVAGVNGENFRFLADGHRDTKWYHEYGTSYTTSSVMYTMYAPTKATKYELRAASDSGSNTQRNPKAWTVQGSNDFTAAASDPLTSTKWVTLDSQANQTTNLGNYSVRPYGIPAANVGSYRYYRLNITALNGTQPGGFFQQYYRVSLTDWLLFTDPTTVTIPGTPFIPGTPAGPDTPAIPAGGSSFGLRLKGSISLPKLKIQVVPGAKTQSYCPTAAP